LKDHDVIWRRLGTFIDFILGFTPDQAKAKASDVDPYAVHFILKTVMLSTVCRLPSPASNPTS